jgi:tetratricopeptide (TPR) repeat protein
LDEGKNVARVLVSKVPLIVVMCCLGIISTAAQEFTRKAPTVSVHQLRIPIKAREELDKAARAYLKGDRTESRVRVERLLEKYPFFAEALAWHGILNAEDQRFEQACADLEKAIEYEPTLVLAYGALGATYNSMVRWGDALRVLERAMQSNPVYWQLYYESARAFGSQNNIQSALEQIAKAERLATADDNAIVQIDRLKELLTQRR